MIEHLVAIAGIFAARIAPITLDPVAMGHTIEFDLNDWRCHCGARLAKFQSSYGSEDRPFWTAESHTTFTGKSPAKLEFLCRNRHVTSINLGILH